MLISYWKTAKTLRRVAHIYLFIIPSSDPDIWSRYFKSIQTRCLRIAEMENTVIYPKYLSDMELFKKLDASFQLSCFYINYLILITINSFGNEKQKYLPDLCKFHYGHYKMSVLSKSAKFSWNILVKLDHLDVIT